VGGGEQGGLVILEAMIIALTSHPNKIKSFSFSSRNNLESFISKVG